MKKGVSKFFKYARERQQIHLKKKAGDPWPWTKDPILQKYRFCSVFREDDRTTVWFREHVRDPLRDSPRVLLATVVFRMFNRIETGEAIFCDDALLGIGHSAFAEFLQGGKVSVLKRAILKRLGKRGPYVTGSYTIMGPAGLGKLDGVLEVIRRFYKKDDWELIAKHALVNTGSVTLEQMWDTLRVESYLGVFHSYEIVTDLRHTALLERAPDVMTWASPGPGARRGLNHTYGRPVNDKSVSREGLIEEMRVITEHSRDPNLWPKDWPKWEMRDTEHTMCEWWKYERTRLGISRPKGTYR